MPLTERAEAFVEEFEHFAKPSADLARQEQDESRRMAEVVK